MSITLSDLEIALQEDANNNKALIAKHKKEIQELENNNQVELLKKRLSFLDKMHERSKQYALGAIKNATQDFLAQQSLMKEVVENRYFNDTYINNGFFSINGGSLSVDTVITTFNPPLSSPYPGILKNYRYDMYLIDETIMRAELKTKLDAHQSRIDQLKLKVEMLEKQQFLVDMQIKTITAFENQLFSGNNPGLSHLHNQSLPSSSNDSSVTETVGLGIAGGATVSLGLIAMVKLYDCYTKRKQQVAPLAPVVPIRQEVVQPEPEPEQEPADNGEGGDVLLAMLNAPDPIPEDVDDNEPGGPEGMPHGENRRRSGKCNIM